MAHGVPPEFMTPEQRAARTEELRREISREWLRYAITEAIVIFVPWFVFLLVYVTTDAISEGALVPAVIVAMAASTMLVLYFLFQRIRPLQRELDHIVALDGRES
jgi:hypothetical protein